MGRKKKSRASTSVEEEERAAEQEVAAEDGLRGGEKSLYEVQALISFDRLGFCAFTFDVSHPSLHVDFASICCRLSATQICCRCLVLSQ